ncbi:MAG: VOC family protein, partial [Rhodoplanes sp.]
PLERAILRLRENGVAIEEGPVERTGAMGRIRSVYVRDPDGNLLEISEYVEKIRPIQERGGEVD